MPKDLPCQNHCWRHALVAHTLRIWLVILAIEVHLIANTLGESAVLALGIWGMTLGTFLLLLNNPVVKAFVLKDSFISVDTVGAFSASWMLAFDSGRLRILWSDSQTVNTFLVWTMSAFRLLVLFIGHWLLCCWLCCCSWFCGSIYHFFILILLNILLCLLSLCVLHSLLNWSQLYILVANMKHITIFKSCFR